MGRKSKFVIVFISFLICYGLNVSLAQQKVFKWKTISGNWENRKDNREAFLIETKSKTRDWGYSELINFNSLITENPVPDYSYLRCTLSVINPSGDAVAQMAVFALKDLRDFYAFKFTGDREKITRVMFVSSKIKDTTKSPSEKWNFEVKELASKETALEYNRNYKIEISVSRNKATLFIDGKKVLEGVSGENMNGGKIGFSNRNAMLKIADLKVFKGNAVVFQDDFSVDTVKRWKVTAERLTKEDYEKRQKEKEKAEKK